MSTKAERLAAHQRRMRRRNSLEADQSQPVAPVALNLAEEKHYTTAQIAELWAYPHGLYVVFSLLLMVCSGWARKNTKHSTYHPVCCKRSIGSLANESSRSPRAAVWKARGYRA